jgi:hypothetical protein
MPASRRERRLAIRRERTTSGPRQPIIKVPTREVNLIIKKLLKKCSHSSNSQHSRTRVTAQQIFAAMSAARRPCPFIPAAIRAVSSFCCSAAPMILVAATRVPNSSYQVVRGGCDGLRGRRDALCKVLRMRLCRSSDCPIRQRPSADTKVAVSAVAKMHMTPGLNRIAPMRMAGKVSRACEEISSKEPPR